jgi:type IV pilus assembly protein PilX
MTRRPPPARLRPAREQGVVLVVVLVMLVVLGLAAASTMRNVTGSEQVAQGARNHSSASQYAMAALMYCERLARDTPAVSIMAPPAAADAAGNVTLWERSATWFAASGTQPNLVPDAAIKPTDATLTSGIVLPPRPQCIAECVSLPTPAAGYTPSTRCNGANEAVYVTARGFSGDFTADANGHTTTGSAVWVQSILRMN